MASLLKPSPPSDLEEVRSDSALEYYAKHTAQIEVSTLKEKKNPVRALLYLVRWLKIFVNIRWLWFPSTEFFKLWQKVASYPSHQNSIIKNGFHRAVFEN